MRGFSQIHPFHSGDWRIGKGLDNAYRRYYLAVYAGKRCFIKIGTNDATVRNEYQISIEQQGKPFSFSPEYLAGDPAFAKNTVMIAVAFIDGLKEFEIPDTKELFEDICRQFIVILDTLKNRDIVHGDIHKGNLMMNGSTLILMDYGISMIKSKGNQIDYRARPGTFYSYEGSQRVYDDAYSFVKMVEKSSIPRDLLKSKVFLDIQHRIGENSFKVDA